MVAFVAPAWRFVCDFKYSKTLIPIGLLALLLVLRALLLFVVADSSADDATSSVPLWGIYSPADDGCYEAERADAATAFDDVDKVGKILY